MKGLKLAVQERPSAPGPEVVGPAVLPPPAPGAPRPGTVAREAAPSDYLVESFRTVLIVGRWLLVLAATLETILVLQAAAVPTVALRALGALAAYNVVSLWVVHRLPLRRIPIPALLLLDALMVALVAFTTGGTDSPFLGQYYLIIFAASLFYGLPGGVGMGALAAAITLVLPRPVPAFFWWDVIDLVPYFILTGAFTGFLVGRLRRLFEVHEESMRRARAAAILAEAARTELELARSVQEAALPKEPPAVPGLDIAARVVFAREVGGDFYLFLRSGDRLGVALGDVSGKGVPAALLATSITHLLPWLRPLADPCRALRDLNRDLLERIPPDTFVSLVLAEIDPAEGRARLWTAGHPPAMLRCARDGRVEQATVFNTVLGLDESVDFAAEEWPLHPGDVLLLYSDGLIEIFNEAGEPFGTERVAELLARHADRSADELVDAILAEASAWGPLRDDLTLLACRRIP